MKDSWHFKEYINNITVPKDYHLISLDVVSLYTNIPVNLALDILNSKWEYLEKFTTLSKNQFLEGTKLCLQSTYFLFNGNCFSQIYGIPLGSSLSSSIANLVMEYIEEDILSTIPFHIPLYKRFVDDIILTVPITETNNILQTFNNYHHKIKFTIENDQRQLIF